MINNNLLSISCVGSCSLTRVQQNPYRHSTTAYVYSPKPSLLCSPPTRAYPQLRLGHFRGSKQIRLPGKPCEPYFSSFHFGPTRTTAVGCATFSSSISTTLPLVTHCIRRIPPSRQAELDISRSSSQMGHFRGIGVTGTCAEM
jgi:hypothetical protein